ncbi:hypothetical protein N7510_001495 [Penicillium lagena]|uniref:uncharacterized protein n=1 Tax=Penicillium lagena TaxID=94218 RepID=UPI0025420CBA|nr:uncharacterized protein N7510_001495 [Penicillium lagena]KAJ5625186.1 hypothetical protein N7510_001495 [Penicillium lagena]
MGYRSQKVEGDLAEALDSTTPAVARDSDQSNAIMIRRQTTVGFSVGQPLFVPRSSQRALPGPRGPQVSTVYFYWGCMARTMWTGQL